MILLALLGCTPTPPLPARILTLLEARQGPTLILPVEVQPGFGAPDDTSERWAEVAALTGVELVSEGLPSTQSPLYAETLVILSVIAHEGTADLTLPPDRPGFVLSMLGVEQIVIDRGALGEQGMAFLDPILRRELSPPSRDIVGDIDVYYVQPRTGALPPADTPLFRVDEEQPPGWRTLEAYLNSW